RVWSFCIMPPLCFAPAWLLCVLACGSCYSLIELVAGPSADAYVAGLMAHIGKSPALLPIFELLLNAVTIGWFAAMVCRLARQSAAGLRWAMFACAGCAVHGLFFHINLTVHNLSIGYSWRPNWVCALTPLLVAGGALLRQRQRERRAIAVLALPILVAGLF